ncbi:MMPL family transporter [Kitasatospora sp. NPDC127067]|uniref:MMPL family transporter n=1 Tax=Kitasatospora sp. NPDC127067 TaxID=3347126 RepID=UPI0036471C06
MVAAFTTLGVAGFGQFRVLGPAVAVSVLVMLLAGLTLMPAVLAACGRALFWPSRVLKTVPRDGAAARFADLVARRPVVMVLASLALLAALAGGLAGIRMDYGLGGGPRTASRTTAAEISRALPAGVVDPTSVHVETEGAGPLSPGALDGLTQGLTRVTGVGQVTKPVLSEDRQAARTDLFAPVVLMLSVGLGFAATLGAAALLFQHAMGKPGVNFTLPLPLPLPLPLVLFLFVVALGTDYNILISDRIREEMEHPGPPRAAVARALRHTAPAIATAGLVLAGSFASLAVTPQPSTQQIGFATALGILLAAFLLSIVLVPALAALLGRSLWWPLRPGCPTGRPATQPQADTFPPTHTHRTTKRARTRPRSPGTPLTPTTTAPGGTTARDAAREGRTAAAPDLEDGRTAGHRPGRAVSGGSRRAQRPQPSSSPLRTAPTTGGPG